MDRPAPRSFALGRPSASPRRGSVTLIALVALVVMGIFIMALHYTVGSRYKQVHHAYYNEKAMALIEGLNAIARGEAQGQLAMIIEAAGEWHEVTGVLEKAEGLRLLEKDTAIKPECTVSARILRGDENLHYFQKTNPVTTVAPDVDPKAPEIFKPGGEVEGIVEIKVTLDLGGFEGVNFRIPTKSVVTQYEFKRIRRIPRFLRHFTLFVKNAITGEEDPDDFAAADSNFNFARVPLTGAQADVGVMFLNNGTGMGSLALPTVDEGPVTDQTKAANPFYRTVGYVYLGGEEKAAAYLNLTAGDDKQPYSETFQLYRGQTTDFYKVWDIDFSNFIEKARAQAAGTDRPPASTSEAQSSWLQSAWNWVKDKVSSFVGWLKRAVTALAQLDALEYTGTAEKSANLPLYYIVRKDYGYALEWGQNEAYRRFGFGSGSGSGGGGAGGGGGQTILCNTLHLYGTENFKTTMEPCPTLVMGNVYRRFLSLAGYKQRRASEAPSTDRKFEVQAGPIEYFKTYKDLMKRTADPTKDQPDEAPIWVWDARVDWNRNAAAANGTYLPLSGAGLFGRLIPGLARLWEDSKDVAIQLFNFSIVPPDELAGGKPAEESGEVITEGGSDFNEDVAGGVSPLFTALHQGGFFEKPPSFGQGRLWQNTSPYFEELMRCFAYASFGAMKKVNEGGAAEEGLDDPKLKVIVEAAATRWQETLTAVQSGQIKAQAIKFPDDIKEAESKKKAPFWVADTRDASDPAGDYFPFSLPDPWMQNPDFTGGFQEAFEKHCPGDKEDFFKRYFYHIMTNPAMVQPYNNGMRFMFRSLRDMFSKSGDDRMKDLSENVIPEVRDGISFIVKGKNDYLERDAKERFNKPINDKVLEAILAQRQGDVYLQKGYFFMDDYGPATKKPSDVDLADAFKGRRHFWKMDWKDFERRFVRDDGESLTIRLNTIVVLTEPLKITKPVKVVGGGAILLGSGGQNEAVTIDGECEIMANLEASAPLFILAKNIKVGGDAEQVHANLVALEAVTFTGNNEVEVRGGVCCGAWQFRRNVVSGGGRYLVTFNNAIKGDDSYLQNIEPRIHRFLLLGGDQR